ncbi:MAG: MerR family transcriptional regulator [Flavobacteriales bacterium]|nr:MerR family transcriptional regulator [Flavobacteriales bacterium]
MQTDKLYYTIGEVASMYKVKHSLIRFWEKEFAIIHLHKSSKGNRLFTKKDLEIFEKIYQLVKVQGYTLEGAKKALKIKEELPLVSALKSTQKEEELKKRLIELRLKLKQLKQSLH